MSRNAHVALVTCFNEDETVNYEATRAQVRRQVAAGNDLMVCGTNGDFTALTHDEKIRLIEEVMDEVAGRVKVIANIGCSATFETLQLAKAVDGLGLHGVAVITPYFIACTQDGLIRHFTTIADAVKTPVYLYDIPARTQNHIEPETCKVLARHPNIAGIKDSGGSTETVLEYLAVAREVGEFEVYCAPDHLVLWGLEEGCAGVVSGLGNVAPDVLAQIISGFNSGDMEAAKTAQENFAGLRKDLYALGFPPALVKRALYLNDASVGMSRQPALLPDAEQDAKIVEILKARGLKE
ncbi:MULTISPECIES: 4-hydroxy-tetrahydrodipicolinate synthase [unclassified Thioclava]|uniref:4-hydroxy-tetrahydrodipicolinate synthase n=1 Tax=unclassified Thioclava TaxID=2621713 RepID=UPI000995E994|nr:MULTISPECIES: 4-hydroxy-tetrahydrodipicolinate synthase [unclassified Thioclava]OOY02973.1 4-hydroxy-tetrahydrodipicolinate synthase [Thioclava sp. F28-4]OWY08885.1 4-hydroxy-tetrahydrodipicolinate synthase [Thioclava sp. F34-6]